MGKRRVLASWLGAAIAVAPVLVPRSAAATGPDSAMESSSRVKGLNDRAQAAYADNNFQGAALSWSEILKVLPENRTNREERETALLVAVDAYIRAYDEGPSQRDEAALRQAIADLQIGVDTFDRYETQYIEVYGTGAQVSLEARERGEAIHAKLAEAKAGLPTPQGPAEPTPVSNPGIQGPGVVVVARPDPGASGLGLIVGGSAAIVGGIGATSMIIVGAVIGRRAQRDSRQQGLSDGEKDDISRRVKTGNGLIIGGSVLTGVLVIGGATMLGFGIKRRIRYLAVSPAVHRGYVGVSLGGRF